MSYSRDQLENWLKTIDVKSDSVLDIGGGANPVKDRVKSWDVKKYMIMDNSLEEMKQKPDIDFDINREDKVVYGALGLLKFDTIFCIEVFDYVWNPVMALKNIYAWLNKGGTLYISFPFVYPHHAPKEYDCLRYTEWGVKKLLKEVGFEVLDLVHRKARNKETLFEFYVGEGMHMAKEFPNHSDIGYSVKARKI